MKLLCVILGCQIEDYGLVRSPNTSYTHYRHFYCLRCGEDYGIVKEYHDSRKEPELFGGEKKEMCFDLTNIDVDILQRIQNKCYGQAKAMGWHSLNEKDFCQSLVLIHSELSEALEGYRKDLMDEHLPHRKMVEVELADAMIRLFDLAGSHGYDLAGAIAEKHHYNAHREDHKIENRLKVGGKKF